MTTLSQLVDHVEQRGNQTVPDALLGCWRRNWIRFGDNGDLERDVTVIWLQTASGMADLRIDPEQEPDQTDSSCGITVVDESTTPYVTADWVDGESGFSQQPTSSFPEKGWLTWDSDTIMKELAPSGSYVEEWEKLSGSGDTIAHFVARDTPTTTNLYICGRHVLLAVRRSEAETVHEYSYGAYSLDADGDSVVIEHSTLADRVGSAMHLDMDWQDVSCRRL